MESLEVEVGRGQVYSSRCYMIFFKVLFDMQLL